ncbi:MULTISPECIES: hypothetical protein [Bacillus]|uniref:Uncharacterized protein n=1 Tax=Bacillus cereus TaxID=1396 RepID=A0AAE9TDT6_BACCE|nr:MULTISPECIES: hypothetical protein [Bacillus cereus group]AJG56577.1 hypothetical protein AS54_3140 [Bacillus cereus 03BB102]AJG58060.1 hypothetical protein AW22_1557 [Bacillus cereus D17]AJH66884.1 hypothetical protein BF32_697 [Bacillus thuringiensis]MCU5028095.1 hypothetical protein [Bacillus cereus]MCU5056755.1 hypothetical protein [Bacillus cereus]
MTDSFTIHTNAPHCLNFMTTVYSLKKTFLSIRLFCQLKPFL